MTCRRAALLLSLQLDQEISPRELRALHAHLDRCPTCAAFARGLESVTILIQDDADRARSAATPSDAFESCLHSVLRAERAATQSRPIARLRALLSRPHLTRRALLVACTLVLQPVLLLVLAAAALLCSGTTAPEPLPTGHLASISVRTTADGRAYAQIQQRTAVPRAVQRRYLP